MSLKAIETLLADNIFPQLSTPGAVFMWTIDQFLWSAEAMMRRMGFKLHARIIWNKLNGPAPAFTIRYAHEYLLWFYRPRMLAIDTLVRGKHTDVLVEKSLQHSRKPDAAYELINSLYPTERKLDVFARRVIHGWDGWGGQYEGRVEAWPESVRGLLQ
jgi:N6-adenosine-specific RNA methylase IME4